MKNMRNCIWYPNFIVLQVNFIKMWFLSSSVFLRCKESGYSLTLSASGGTTPLRGCWQIRLARSNPLAFFLDNVSKAL